MFDDQTTPSGEQAAEQQAPEAAVPAQQEADETPAQEGEVAA